MRRAGPALRLCLLGLLAIVLGAGGCSGERPGADADPLPVPIGSLAERSTLFEGTLPCADCPGIRYRLLLRPDSVFFLRRSYLGANVVDFDEIGRWYLDADARIVRLRGPGDSSPEFLVVSSDSLRPLREDGTHATDSAASLLRREESAPFEPRLRMRGMFMYLAESPIFRECASEWRLPIVAEAGFATLERAYEETVAEPGSPLLAEFDGWIKTRPAVDREGFEDVVVVEEFVGVWPGETCGARGASATLENTYWGLVRVGREAVQVGHDEREIHLRFLGETNQLRGFAGCNAFTGTYLAEGWRMSFGALASSRSDCPYKEQETLFFETLPRVARHVITGDHLELFDAEGRMLLRFEARYFR